MKDKQYLVTGHVRSSNGWQGFVKEHSTFEGAEKDATKLVESQTYRNVKVSSVLFDVEKPQVSFIPYRYHKE